MFVAAALYAAALQAADGFYLGSLKSGDRELPVAVELRSEGGGALSGWYFYFGKQERLSLRGTLTPKGAVRLLERAVDGAPTGLWMGTLEAGGIRGHWSAARSARAWSFELVRSENASRYFAGAPVSVDAGRTGRLGYAMAKVPASQHLVPLITAFGNSQVVSAINAALLSAANAAHCGSLPDDHAFDATVSLVSEDVLSVRVKESWFCGAAYPTTDADRSLLFDLKSGAAIERSDLFRKDASTEAVAAVLFAWELAQARAGARGPDEEQCLDLWTTDRLSAASFSHYLTPAGLVVRPEFAHAFEACANEVTVPYAALASIAAPEGALARLAAAHAKDPRVYRVHRPGTPPASDVRFAPPAK